MCSISDDGDGSGEDDGFVGDAGDPGTVGDGSGGTAVDNSGFIDNGDGTQTDPSTGNIIDANGDVVGNTSDSAIAGMNTPAAGGDPLDGYATIDPFGNASTFYGRDASGNAVYQSFDVNGTPYYVVVDAGGNVVQYADANFDPISAAALGGASAPGPGQASGLPGGSNSGGGGGGSLGGGSGGSGSSNQNAAIQKLAQLLAQAQASGAPLSTQNALAAALARAQSTTTNYTPLLIGGALLALLLLRRS